jgi:hypothetical protein
VGVRYFLPWEQLDMYGNHWRRELGSRIPTSDWLSTDCYIMAYMVIGTGINDGRHWITKGVIGKSGHLQFPSPREAMAAQDAVMRANGHYLIDADEVERFEKMAVML